jgi:adenylate cyclase class 2
MAPDFRRQNIELKVRVASLDAIRAAAAPLAQRRLEDQQQLDTYFRCAHGRLKLREINDQQAQLIWYQREDRAEARSSAYEIVQVADPAGLKHALQQACGILVAVAKHREILLFHNVRIHLDRVEGLGQFVELESVVGPQVDESLARSRLQHLLDVLPLDAREYLSQSYSDMLLSR